jgi:multidrug resistance protein MdtO
MTVAASDTARGARVWQRLIEPSSERLAFSVRLALICTAVAILGEIYQTPEVALTVYIAFFMNKPDRVSSIALAVGFTLTTTVVVCLLVALAPPLLANPALRVFTMAAISFVIMFLASASQLKPLAPTLGLVFAYALDLLGAFPFGEAATRALLYAWLCVGIPALVSVVVNLCIAPAPRTLVEKGMAERLRRLAQVLTTANRAARQQRMQRVWQGIEGVQGTLKLAAVEKTSKPEDIRALRSSADCLVAMLCAVQLMLDEPDALPSENVRRTIANRLCEAASAFEAGGYPARLAPILTDSQIPALALSALSMLNHGLTQFGELSPFGEAKERPSFFEPDAFQNSLHVRFALKVTGAAMLCYLLYSGLNWPGIHTAMITCFIVSLGTTAESVEKLMLRIGGCLAGAALGIVVMLRVIPHATDIGHLALLVSVGAFIGAWIAAGDKHISYAGFQFAFAYLLCVIQGPSPMFDLVVARDRVIGILVGNVVSYLVASYVWPVSVGTRIESESRALAAALQQTANAPDPWSRRRKAAETTTLLEQMSSDLLLASYEPLRIRPAYPWLLAQRRVCRTARKLNEMLVNTSAAVLETIEDISSVAPLEVLLRTRMANFRKARAAITEGLLHE